MNDKEIDLLEKMMQYTVAKMNSDRLGKFEWHQKIQQIKSQLKDCSSKIQNEEM